MKALRRFPALALVLVLDLMHAATPSTNTPPTAAPAVPAPPPSALEQWITDSKQPLDWLTWGADLRIRDEYFENTFMLLNPEVYNQLRTRARLWANVRPHASVEAFTRLSWESRFFTSPGEPVPAYTPASRVDRFEPEEFILDNLGIRLTNLFEVPLQITIGRQDMFFGNGWLFGDGTPRDGSRTYFLDAARVAYTVPAWKTVFNGIYIDQGSETDRWLTPINAQDHRFNLTEQNERAGVLYVINQSLPKTQLDAYVIYRDDERVMASGVEGHVFTMGARVQTDVGTHWRVRAEVAPEWGEKNGRDLEAFGLNSQLSYLFKDRVNNQVRIGYEFLSGNDPRTAANERFDPLWGRWPQWSELLVYNLTTGPRPVEWGNLQRVQIGWTTQPWKGVTCSADYHLLLAVEDEIAPLNEGGTRRGDLAVLQVEYLFNKHIKGHVRGEFFWPGDYYDGSVLTRETQLFLRGEVYLTW